MLFYYIVCVHSVAYVTLFDDGGNTVELTRIVITLILTILIITTN